jgi:hypothetical protein
MNETITLPLLEALDYLYKNNLTIDELWAVDKLRDPTKATEYLRRETHITVKPRDTS